MKDRNAYLRELWMASCPPESPNKQKVLCDLQWASYRQSIRLRERRTRRRQNVGLWIAVILFLVGVVGLVLMLSGPKPNLRLLKTVGIVWGGVVGALLLMAPVLGYMLQKEDEQDEQSEN